MYSVEWRCPVCEKPGEQELDSARRLDCTHCDHEQRLAPAATDAEGGVCDPLPACVACGYDRLYTQKDFNRKVGLGIVVVGAVLSPWTYGLSLLACMALDYGMYRFVPEITVCYGCDAIHRGFEHNPLHRAHDPLLADRYRREATADPDAAEPGKSPS